MKYIADRNGRHMLVRDDSLAYFPTEAEEKQAWWER